MRETVSAESARPPVFVTGATGYVGRPLVEILLCRGFTVHALARRGSESRVPTGARVIVGDALDARTYAPAVPPGATFVHLVGTPHPNPRKAAEFLRVDLTSTRAATSAAVQSHVRNFVYVSVAHPAPVMHAYIAARKEGEALVAATHIPATILRPWYVLGPGHRWPYLLVPVYAILRRIPATQEGATRLGLVTRDEMLGALVQAVEAPPTAGVSIVDVAGIRASASQAG